MFLASIGGSLQRSLEWLLMQVTVVVSEFPFVQALNLCFAALTSRSSHLCLHPSPLNRILLLHLWHAQESRPQTFPGAPGSAVFRQSRCPDSKTASEPALRRRGRCRRADDIVSAAVGQRGGCLVAGWLRFLIEHSHLSCPALCFHEFRYPLDVARRRMQLGAILPDSEKCV